MSLPTSGETLLASAFELKRDLEGRFLELGRVLKLIRDSKAWSAHYQSFDNPANHNFLVDLGMKKSTANRLILIYEKFVLEGGVSPTRLLEVGSGKLGETIAYIKNKEDVEEMLSLAVASPTQAVLRSRLREIRTGVSQDDCAHNDTYEITICRSCGHRASTSLSNAN